MTPQEVVQSYVEHGLKIVTWPAVGDAKGPREKNWTNKQYSLTDYREGYRVGLLTGVEVAPSKWLVDIDLDWAPGQRLAIPFLPGTDFVYGRKSKYVSHFFYTTSEPLPSFRYEDVDKTVLLELRGTTASGGAGMQSMAPPSEWTKGTQREPLEFRGPSEKGAIPKFGHVESPDDLKRGACLTAIAMIFAKHLGRNGFGHSVRLMWAGYLLRMGVTADELVKMGEAMSEYCTNREVEDVRTTVESTAMSLADPKKKVVGGPSLAKHIGQDGKAVIARINEWLGRDADFARDKNGQIVAKSQANVKRAVELLGRELSYNDFSAKMLIDGKPLEDPQTKDLWLTVDREYHFQPPWDYFKIVVEDTAWHNMFHPVKQYLEKLTWDQVPRVDMWLITAAKAEDTKYVRAVSSIMLIAAVRRIMSPGCKYDEMVVWESKQGSYKSSAAQALCPDPDWFSDDLRLNLNSQQLIEATLGKWIIEASDLAGKRKTEIEQLKSMLSRQRDGPARLAYKHFPEERPRHFILIGTTNSKVYLNDPTGARRFWPMEVQPFDVEWIKENRDQLWAEAVMREGAGESIRLHESLWPAATEHQEKRREIDPWEELIRATLIAVEPSADGRRRITTNALWETALHINADRRDRTGSLRISDIMQRLGFKRTRVRPQGEDVQVGFVQDGIELELSEPDDVEREPGDDETPF